MNNLYITNANIYTNGSFAPGDLLVENGSIAAVGRAQNKGYPLLDAQGAMLLPGFIDIHTHGAAGVDVNNASVQELQKIAAFFAAQGTTGWLASVLTDTPQKTLWCMQQITQAMQQSPQGAAILGIHLEGPHLAAEYKGAMPQHLLAPPDPALFERYQTAANGAVRYMTVSPELAGMQQLVTELSGKVKLGFGHSGASYEQTIACIQAGASIATHTFDAMGLFHQHRPGVMGAALETDVFCEAICDGRHLHPGAVRMLLNTKGLDKVIAITDSIMAAGLPDGRYKLGVNDVIVREGDATLPSGVRAGSTLTMIAALRNLVAFTKRPLAQLVPLLTQNPATFLGVQAKKGSIAAGKDADLVLVSDSLQVAATVVGGALVYQNQTI